MVHILVVDDEPDVEFLLKQKFYKEIKAGNVQFAFASDGSQALEKLKENKDIDIVFSDINMPVMDGLALLANISSDHPLIKTVIVSAYGDIVNIRKAMNKGAFDFLVKPIDLDDLEVTLNRAKMASQEVHKAFHEHDDLTRIRKELDVARSIQANFIPQNFQPIPEAKTFEIYGRMIPALTVGGDFFDFFQHTNDRLAVEVGDVCGKGVPAALFMATARTAFRCFSPHSVSISDCVKQVNEFLCYENDSLMFVTVLYGYIDIKTGNLAFCNAGHHSPYVLSEDGKIIQPAHKHSIALGLDDLAVFNEYQIQLKKNDSLIVFSDGVVEAMNPEGHLYGHQRFQNVLANNCRDPLDSILGKVFDDIKDFEGGAEQTDDITILALRFLGE